MHSSALLAALLALAACAPAAEHSAGGTADTLLVSEAASLAGPMRAVLDSFARLGPVPVVVQVEHGGSLELARRVTEMGRVPDILLLADQEVFPELLMPRATSWYMRFARNRMTIAYTDRSRHASEITAQNWREVLQRDDVLLGRPDPAIAPAGYRALLVYRLAESFYQEPGLAARLAARTPESRTRGDAAELAALLEAGELDYIMEYESVARTHRLRFLTLPAEIDLGDLSRASEYRQATVRVARGRDTVTLRGAPILYGMTVPRAAPHPRVALRFARFLAGDDARALLRRGYVDAMARAEIVGDSAPTFLTAP